MVLELNVIKVYCYTYWRILFKDMYYFIIQGVSIRVAIGDILETATVIALGKKLL